MKCSRDRLTVAPRTAASPLSSVFDSRMGRLSGWGESEKPRLTTATPGPTSRKKVVVLSLVILVVLFQTVLYIARARPHIPHNLHDAQEWLKRYSFLHLHKTHSDEIVHPIPNLMQDAVAKHKAMLARQSRTLAQAVAEYKKRYQIDPPLGFDEWWTFAQENNVKIIDDYDNLMKDLAPFRALSGEEIRRRSDQVRTIILQRLDAHDLHWKVGHLPSIDLVRLQNGNAITLNIQTGFDDSEVSARAKGFRVMIEKFQHTVRRLCATVALR